MFDWLFMDFVDNLREFDNYEIGITDADGRFVASTNEAMKGKVSGEALRIMGNGVSSMRDGVGLCEVYAVIIVKKNLYGVLWVRGNEESIDIVCKLILNSLKIRIEVELGKQMEKVKATIEDQLVHCLIHYKEGQREGAELLAKELGVNLHVPRIVILAAGRSRKKFRIGGGQFIQKKRLLLSRTDDSHYAILVEHDEPLHSLSFQKKISALAQTLNRDSGISIQYYVSMPQESWGQIATAWNQCCFLERNIRRGDSILYVKDHLEAYFMSFVPEREYEAVFKPMMYEQPSFDLREFISIFDVMVQNDFNITQSSRQLFMHKNSLIYKINKYRQMFDMDMIGSHEGKTLLSYWLYWLKRNERGEE